MMVDTMALMIDSVVLIIILSIKPIELMSVSMMNPEAFISVYILFNPFYYSFDFFYCFIYSYY